MAEASIAIYAKDNYSTTVGKMSDNTERFSKQAEELQHRLNALNKAKTTLQVDAAKAENELKAAKKAFRETGDEMSRLNLEAKQADYNNVKSNLSAVSKEAQQAEKDIYNMSNTLSKAGNKASGGTGAGGAISALAKAGFIQMAGQQLSESALTLISSAGGSEAGTMASSMLSSAASGAGIGTMILPGVGTAIGAAVGAGIGAISGATQIYEDKDSAFKDYVQSAVEGQIEERAAGIETGSGIAGGRETNLVSFSTLFDDENVAKEYLEQIKNLANTTPFLYDDLTAMSKTLKTFNFGVEEMLPTLTNIGDTGAALGMTTSDMSMVATALGRMRTTGKTTLEYLNLLTERGINATGWISEAKGISVSEVYDKISKGELAGGETVDLLLEKMKELYSGSMELQSHTYEGLSSTLEGWENEMNNAYGEGYNEARKKGMQEQIEWYSSDGGTEMAEVNRKIGEYYGELENLKEQYIREAYTAVMESDEYKTAEANGDALTTGRLLQEAKIQGMNEYNANEGAQAVLASELALAQTVRADTAANEEYWNAGHERGIQYTKGLAASLGETIVAVNTAFSPKNLFSEDKNSLLYRWTHSGKEDGSNAAGLATVPYDGYLALLHQGESVLTARETRQAQRGNASGVTIQVNGLTVREDADIDRIASAFVEKMMQASLIT